MIELDNQQAIGYLSRLNTTLEPNSQMPDYYSQGPLLLTLLRLELALLQTYPETDDQKGETALTITPSGFPTIIGTLSHTQSALNIHQSQISDRKNAATKFLDSIASLNPDQIVTQVQTVSRYPDSLLPIASILANCTAKQIRYLEQVSWNASRRRSFYENLNNNQDFEEDEEEAENTQYSDLPIYHRFDRLPALLISRPQENPFTQNWGNDRVNPLEGQRFYRKFIDSPTYPFPKSLGSEQEPLDPNDLPTLPRPPAIIAGMIKNDKPQGTFKIGLTNIGTWTKRPDADKARYDELLPQSAHDLVALSGVNTALSLPLLTVDFTHMSDRAIDNILAALPEVNFTLSTILAQVDLFAQNQPVDLSKIETGALKLASLINDNRNFHIAREAIGSAVKRLLKEKHNELLREEKRERIPFSLFGKKFL